MRVLGDADLAAALAVVGRDPVANVFVGSRLETVGLDPRRLGAEVWGWSDGDGLAALCYSGANLVPVETGADAARAFAERARRQGRHCSSIVGPRHAVEAIWHELAPHWGRARDVRTQPLMATATPPTFPRDPLVRRVQADEIDVLLPACIAMFTEEVGVSPTVGDGGALYRARVAELIAEGRSFARFEGDRVVFKAEIGAVTRSACQVQGVWVDPTRRGEGLSVAGMASVLDEVLRSVAPMATLYVNDFNHAARAAYERVGFDYVGEFVSVLF